MLERVGTLMVLRDAKPLPGAGAKISRAGISGPLTGSLAHAINLRAATPGPGSYSVNKIQPPKGGTISKHKTLNFADAVIRQHSNIPGPGSVSGYCYEKIAFLLLF